jgi:hypothetical protein
VWSVEVTSETGVEITSIVRTMIVKDSRFKEVEDIIAAHC